MLSESTEMYLITVYRLTTRQTETTIREVADRLGVALSSASEKVRVLTEQGYLTHAWREGVSLTDMGQRIAMRVLRKNRLATTIPCPHRTRGQQGSYWPARQEKAS